MPWHIERIASGKNHATRALQVDGRRHPGPMWPRYHRPSAPNIVPPTLPAALSRWWQVPHTGRSRRSQASVSSASPVHTLTAYLPRGGRPQKAQPSCAQACVVCSRATASNWCSQYKQRKMRRMGRVVLGSRSVPTSWAPSTGSIAPSGSIVTCTVWHSNALSYVPEGPDSPLLSRFGRKSHGPGAEQSPSKIPHQPGARSYGERRISVFITRRRSRWLRPSIRQAMRRRGSSSRGAPQVVLH